MASFCKTAVLVVILAGICAAEKNDTASTSCYFCNSYSDSKCEDPVDKDNIEFKTVPCPSGQCYKYHQEVNDDIRRLSRGCTTDIEPSLKRKDLTEGCVFSTGTKAVQLQICTCQGDKCNSADSTRSPILVLMTAAMIAFLAHLLY